METFTIAMAKGIFVRFNKHTSFCGVFLYILGTLKYCHSTLLRVYFMYPFNDLIRQIRFFFGKAELKEIDLTLNFDL